MIKDKYKKAREYEKKGGDKQNKKTRKAEREKIHLFRFLLLYSE